MLSNALFFTILFASSQLWIPLELVSPTRSVVEQSNAMNGQYLHLEKTNEALSLQHVENLPLSGSYVTQGASNTLTGEDVHRKNCRLFDKKCSYDNMKYNSMEGYYMNCSNSGREEMIKFPLSEMFWEGVMPEKVIALDFHGNMLTQVSDFDIKAYFNLRVLILHGNLISNVESFKFTKSLSNLKVLSLGHNPFPCDCKISWLWRDYHNFYQILPRNLTGFHSSKLPSGSQLKGSVPEEFPPMFCFEAGSVLPKTFDEIDLSHCRDDFSVDGKWSTWSPWQPCKKLFSGKKGIKLRSRTCSSPAPKNGGHHCEGSSIEIEPCARKFSVGANWPLWKTFVPKLDGSTNICRGNSTNPPSTYGKINGNLGKWSSWQPCNSTCGNGTKTRQRKCTNPAAKNGGEPCEGLPFETVECEFLPCEIAIDGNWTEWSSWQPCAQTCVQTCGNSTKARQRECTNPRPENGGELCKGASYDIEICKITPCNTPVHGTWAKWSPWRRCSTRCGNGTKNRVRLCVASGNATCIGPSEQQLPCEIYCSKIESKMEVLKRLGINEEQWEEMFYHVIYRVIEIEVSLLILTMVVIFLTRCIRWFGRVNEDPNRDEELKNVIQETPSLIRIHGPLEIVNIEESVLSGDQMRGYVKFSNIQFAPSTRDFKLIVAKCFPNGIPNDTETIGDSICLTKNCIQREGRLGFVEYILARIGGKSIMCCLQSEDPSQRSCRSLSFILIDIDVVARFFRNQSYVSRPTTMQQINSATSTKAIQKAKIGVCILDLSFDSIFPSYLPGNDATTTKAIQKAKIGVSILDSSFDSIFPSDRPGNEMHRDDLSSRTRCASPTELKAIVASLGNQNDGKTAGKGVLCLPSDNNLQLEGKPFNLKDLVRNRQGTFSFYRLQPEDYWQHHRKTVSIFSIDNDLIEKILRNPNVQSYVARARVMHQIKNASVHGVPLKGSDDLKPTDSSISEAASNKRVDFRDENSGVTNSQSLPKKEIGNGDKAANSTKSPLVSSAERNLIRSRTDVNLVEDEKFSKLSTVEENNMSKPSIKKKKERRKKVSEDTTKSSQSSTIIKNNCAKSSELGSSSVDDIKSGFKIPIRRSSAQLYNLTVITPSMTMRKLNHCSSIENSKHDVPNHKIQSMNADKVEKPTTQCRQSSNHASRPGDSNRENVGFSKNRYPKQRRCSFSPMTFAEKVGTPPKHNIQKVNTDHQRHCSSSPMTFAEKVGTPPKHNIQKLNTDHQRCCSSSPKTFAEKVGTPPKHDIQKGNTGHRTKKPKTPQLLQSNSRDSRPRDSVQEEQDGLFSLNSTVSSNKAGNKRNSTYLEAPSINYPEKKLSMCSKQQCNTNSLKTYAIATVSSKTRIPNRDKHQKALNNRSNVQYPRSSSSVCLEDNSQITWPSLSVSTKVKPKANSKCSKQQSSTNSLKTYAVATVSSKSGIPNRKNSKRQKALNNRSNVQYPRSSSSVCLVDNCQITWPSLSVSTKVNEQEISCVKSNLPRKSASYANAVSKKATKTMKPCTREVNSDNNVNEWTSSQWPTLTNVLK